MLAVRGFEREGSDLGPVDRAERLGQPLRRAEREADRESHVGHRQLRDRRAVDELHHAVHDGLRVDDDVDGVEVDAEQLVRLDHFEALVHQASTSRS